MIPAHTRLLGRLPLVLAIVASCASIANAGDLAGLQKQLRKAIKSNAIFEIEEIAADIVLIDDRDAMEVLMKDGLLSGKPEVEQVVRQALVRVSETGKALEFLCHECRYHRDHVIRDQLTQVLSYVRTVGAYRSVLQNLYDKQDSVVLSSIDALRYKGHMGSVPHLIRSLEHQEKKGRALSAIANQIRKALESLTTHDFHHARDWRMFWDLTGDDFRKPTKAQVKSRKEAEQKGDGIKAGSTGVVVKRRPKPDLPKFFGMELPSQRIVFILDTSVSMKQKDPIPSDVESKGSRIRIHRVQQELRRLVGILPKDTKFSVIAFSDKVRVLSGSLMEATPENKTRARRFVDKFRPEGQTHTDDALKEAFRIKGARTFILLSDGAPVRHTRVMDVPAILAWVRDTNRFRHVQIYTVGFRGARRTIGDFLAHLAHENDGEYHELP